MQVKVLNELKKYDLVVKASRQICALYDREVREQSSSFIPNTTQNLLDIKRVLDKKGIPFWLMFGTFLGAYREGNIISFDDDSDLAIFDYSLYALTDTELLKAGFELRMSHIEGVEKAGLYRNGERTGFAIFHKEQQEAIWKNIRFNLLDFENKNIMFLFRMGPLPRLPYSL